MRLPPLVNSFAFTILDFMAIIRDSTSTAPASVHKTRIMAAIGAMSCASLLLELGLTRLYSVVLFYHFAFLAISCALLGLGAGGVFAYVRRTWLDRFASLDLGFWLGAANALLVLIVLEVVLHVPISLDLSWGNFAKLTALYLASAVPFFVTGLLFSVVFAREARGIGSIYGADLLGGALACMAVVPLLNTIGGPNAIVFSGVLMAVSALIWADTRKRKLRAVALGTALLILIGANAHGKLIDIVYAKGKRRDQPWVLYSKWNAISRIEVDQAGEAKYIVIDADASTAIMNVPPEKWDTNGAPNNLNLIDRPDKKDQGGYNWKKDLMSAAPAIANVLRPNGKFAIIGPGGGVDVLRAVANGSKDVTAIEINPIIATDVMRGKYADYSYHLYERPEVHLHVSDGRSFIRNSKEKYDVIQMTLVDTWASTAAGAFALSENNLYTVEAFEEYFNHLKPDGMIAITRWEFKEPREALRVVSQGIEALQILGVHNTRTNILVISDGDLDVDGRPVAVVIKKNPFTEPELKLVEQAIASHADLHLLYSPADEEFCSHSGPDKNNWMKRYREYSANPAVVAFGGLICNSIHEDRIFVRNYPYNISPVYDKNPFFFFTLKTSHVFKNILAGTGRGMDWRINLGVTVLFMVFAISIVAVLAFLILPLAFDKEAGSSSGGIGRLIYFIAVGLGFILVEITLIQRFVLYLGHPTYALTVVVFLMLLSSGAGSFAARRYLARVSSVRIPLLLIAAGVCSYLVLLPAVLHATIGASFILKLLLSGLLIIPLGFLMGMPFPTGLRALDEAQDRRVEWAWALNAAASVLGSVSAMIIAIHFGLNVTLVCGALAYVVAAALVRSFRMPAAINA